MKIIDPGHKYSLDNLDGNNNTILTFVKREGLKYPGNVGSYEGTNIQEVLRALIDRLVYLDNQAACSENNQILLFLRESIYLLERRAAYRHGHYLTPRVSDEIELLTTCKKCGHIHDELDHQKE